MKFSSTAGLLILTLGCFIGCHSSSKKQDNGEADNAQSAQAPTPLTDTFAKGTVVRNISCVTDAVQNYCLYLPKQYSTDRRWPVIFFFDAHARGKLPLYKYHELADKWGYIFIGSNNSKNGLPLDSTEHTYKALLSDAETRFAINQDRIYTCGFSGGSKVAAAIAILDGGVSGVIGCSAGFPELNQPITNQFDYIGITADGDFNYQEMQELNEELRQMNSQHELLVFEGRHDWPPKETMAQAFYWQHFNAMRAGKIAKDDKILKEYVAGHRQEADRLLKQGDKYDAYQSYSRLIHFVKDLYNTSDIQKKADALGNTDEVKQAIAEKETIKSQESAGRNMYAGDMASKQPEWWPEEIKNLQLKQSSAKDRQLKGLYKRLLASINLMSFMQAYGLMNNGQMPEAEKYVKIYEQTDARNPDGPYLEACIFVAKNEPQMAISALQRAIELGFDDSKRMQAERLLIPLRTEAAFKNIITQADRQE